MCVCWGGCLWYTCEDSYSSMPTKYPSITVQSNSIFSRQVTTNFIPAKEMQCIQKKQKKKGKTIWIKAIQLHNKRVYPSYVFSGWKLNTNTRSPRSKTMTCNTSQPKDKSNYSIKTWKLLAVKTKTILQKLDIVDKRNTFTLSASSVLLTNCFADARNLNVSSSLFMAPSKAFRNCI